MNHLVKVNVDSLKLDMYVSQLDRPWLETKFLFQGFRITDPRDIAMLRANCSYVYVDVEKGAWPDQYELHQRTQVPETLELPSRSMAYEDKTSFHEEMPMAEASYEALAEVVENIMDDVRVGGKINATGLNTSVQNLINSVTRNPDALIWLTRLKQTDNYAFNHSINAAILATSFARHLGLSKTQMNDIAFGTLLYDIGKMKVPQDLLTKPGRLTDKEFELLKKHVDYSIELMKETKGINDRAIDLALNHHERFDGSGYPNKRRGSEIPVFGRMAAIVDCYEAVTSDRPYAKAISSHDAIKKMYEWRKVDFQEELIEQFIQCLGVYPTGTLVELNTGEVGVVFAQNRIRRLRPKLMLILNEEKVAYGCFPIVDLMQVTEGKDGKHIDIAHTLDPGSYGIYPNTLFLSGSESDEYEQASA